jgi:hypothetical protein
MMSRNAATSLPSVAVASSLPFCVEHNRFCLVEDDESGGWLALYTYDPYQAPGERGCLVEWRADFLFVDPATGEEVAGWFRGRCSGSTFDMQGAPRFWSGDATWIASRCG